MLCLLLLRMNCGFLQNSSKSHCSGGLLWSFSLELFPRPVLKASSTQPTEEGTLTLTCETQLSSQRPDVQLQFRFFRDYTSPQPYWRSSPELQIFTIQREDSGSYRCEAQTVTPHLQKQSQQLQINVQSECQWILNFAKPGAGKSWAVWHISMCQWSLWKGLLILVGMGAVWEKKPRFCGLFRKA